MLATVAAEDRVGGAGIYVGIALAGGFLLIRVARPRYQVRSGCAAALSGFMSLDATTRLTRRACLACRCWSGVPTLKIRWSPSAIGERPASAARLSRSPLCWQALRRAHVGAPAGAFVRACVHTCGPKQLRRRHLV